MRLSSTAQRLEDLLGFALPERQSALVAVRGATYLHMEERKSPGNRMYPSIEQEWRLLKGDACESWERGPLRLGVPAAQTISISP